jgi:hypothetical protein
MFFMDVSGFVQGLRDAQEDNRLNLAADNENTRAQLQALKDVFEIEETQAAHPGAIAMNQAMSREQIANAPEAANSKFWAEVFKNRHEGAKDYWGKQTTDLQGGLDVNFGQELSKQSGPYMPKIVENTLKAKLGQSEVAASQPAYDWQTRANEALYQALVLKSHQNPDGLLSIDDVSTALDQLNKGFPATTAPSTATAPTTGAPSTAPSTAPPVPTEVNTQSSPREPAFRPPSAAPGSPAAGPLIPPRRDMIALSTALDGWFPSAADWYRADPNMRQQLLMNVFTALGLPENEIIPDSAYGMDEVIATFNKIMDPYVKRHEDPKQDKQLRMLDIVRMLKSTVEAQQNKKLSTVANFVDQLNAQFAGTYPDVLTIQRLATNAGMPIDETEAAELRDALYNGGIPPVPLESNPEPFMGPLIPVPQTTDITESDFIKRGFGFLLGDMYKLE